MEIKQSKYDSVKVIKGNNYKMYVAHDTFGGKITLKIKGKKLTNMERLIKNIMYSKVLEM